MSLKHNLMIVSALVLAASCGQAPQKKESQKDQIEASAVLGKKADKPAELPAAVIVRVPLNDEGKEEPAQAELRLETSSSLATNEEQAVASFENGKVPSSVKNSHDELDKDSSSQSWFFGRFYRNYNYYYNYGYNYSIGYGYHNNYYSYGYRNYYNYGGYNYYYYPYYGYNNYGYGRY